MKLAELFLLAVGLSMDAFAVSVCAGLTIKEAMAKKVLVIALYFGFFQAFMPLIGYMAARQFATGIIAYGHWIAFGLLCFLGGKMIRESFKQKDGPENEISLRPGQMLPLAVATSIDALAVGVSFAVLQAAILPAVCFIGLTTLALSALGVKVGNMFGKRAGSRATLLGGLILTLIGLKILLEHLNIISF
ncbi:MAG: manganese efflux pump MntP family protein [Clostridiales bacterium]|nr:manganese efflux pump MntP family protein [Clostridiales bacterium]